MNEEQATEKPQCKDCAYYGPEDHIGGLCHRYRPEVFVVPIVVEHNDKKDQYRYDAITQWPKVRATTFCGEFEQTLRAPTAEITKKMADVMRKQL
jgi:hypothetical protein